MGGNIDFEAILRALPDMVAVADPESDRFEWVNDAWTEVLGWTRDEFLSRPFAEFVHPDDLARTSTTAKTRHYEGKVTNFTNRYRHRDGSWRWLEWNSSEYSEGRTFGVARDVTNTRLERIRAVTSSYQTLFERLGKIGFWRSDRRTSDLFWSPQAYEILGVDPESDAPDRSLSASLLHPDDRARAFGIWEAANASGAEFSFDIRICRPDGEVRVVRVVGEPERGPSDELVAFVGVVQDVSEQKLVEGRLRESEKLAGIGTMAAGVAHEINNPLSYVYSNAQFLREELEEIAGPSPSTQLREMINMAKEIEDGGRRIRSIVRGLKAFSRTSDDIPQPLEVATVLDTAVRLCRNEIRHRADLSVAVAPGLPAIVADEGQIVQVLVNLLANAAHALEGTSGRRIAVRATLVEEGVRIEVEDEGAGMSAATKARAFEPFFTTKPQGIGTGLGLSISHGIIKRFGGSIDIRSELGDGTCVSLTLPPASEEALSEAEELRRPTPPVPRGRILIIDDDVTVGQSIARLLQSHDVVVESDPRAALERLTVEDFGLVFCDVMMPGMSGATLARQLAERRPEALERFVWITGGAFDDEARSLVQNTTRPVLEKPVEVAVLRNLVADQLG